MNYLLPIGFCVRKYIQELFFLSSGNQLSLPLKPVLHNKSVKISVQKMTLFFPFAAEVILFYLKLSNMGAVYIINRSQMIYVYIPNIT